MSVQIDNQALRDYFFDPNVCPDCEHPSVTPCNCANPPQFAHNERMALRIATAINRCEDRRFLLRMIFCRQLELYDFTKSPSDGPAMATDFFPCMDGNHARAITEAGMMVLHLRSKEDEHEEADSRAG